MSETFTLHKTKDGLIVVDKEGNAWDAILRIHRGKTYLVSASRKS